MIPRWCLLVMTLASLGCIAYKPAPVDLQAQAESLQARRLSDPGLRAYLEGTSGKPIVPWPQGKWDFQGLTAAALYFSPVLAQARADEARTEADALAAGLRPDPVLSLTNQYQSNTTAGLSPWTAGPSLDITFTTAGKRRIRQAQAAERLRESHLRGEGVRWQVRSSLRSALAGWQYASSRAAATARLAGARDEALSAVDAALKAGEVSRPDLDAARADAEGAHLALSSARQAEASARANLAGALGLPEAALEGITIESLDVPPPTPPEGADALSQALTGRSDVLAALAAYAAADQAYRLAIAEQYPDIHLQPGYLWDQGAVRWELGLALLLPMVNRNRGAIAQAEADRAVAGARLLSVQASVLREVEGAEAGYGAARESLERALAQASARRAALSSARAALAAGEADRLAVALASAGSGAADLDALTAEQDFQVSLGRLEDALERPLSPASPLPPVSPVSPKESP